MQIKPIKNVFCVQLLLVYILQSFRQNFGKLVEVRPLLKWDKLRLFVAPHLALVITSFRVAL
jgi:cytochrome c-type biogenesis protein CcmH/NrfF